MKSKRDATRPPSTQVESTGASVLLGASSPSIHGGEICNSQRDQIRSTIIIMHLDLGGSDSDPSRATSGINKNNTPESAGGSSHASTSSTSDQKQSSIPEESSVSTDSGLDSCDASFEVDEIESPPSEGNTIEEEPSNSIYKRHMYLKKHGFPLWIPQPNLRLSCSYRRRGVSIGDVGIFTAGGGFDFLFNICLPARHPSNPDELPEGFYPLQLKPADVCEFHAHSSHSYIASSSVKKQGETFHCSDSDGALLVMPQGAHEEDLRNISKFRSYTSLHAESWYQYANGPCGREIGNAKLHLVTGCDKTTSWGIAAYSHAQSKCVEDDATLLNFNVSNEARHSLYPRFVWGQQGAADVKAGPEDDELIDLPEVHAVRPLRNQCTFIRSLTTALGVDDWERLQAKVTASADDRISTRSPESPLASVFGAVSSLTGLIGSFRGYSREGTSKLINSVSPEQILSAHPAAYVVDMLLQKCPKAKVVVVHDSDWCSVIRDSVSHELHDSTSSVKRVLG
ncbi:hypothetical protein K443DRAFT_685539 [Laccaria amethystina LaAM-08-1]|uniref:Uncharacterized protein n=1 Tax=Laccaria amethystina LaAM-08-1 TaxID=1095629 RepID=A0A0C9WU86_9AGAR|nr:hypothetical protein K443DRAFT_685539 [Laccaria amethystina LaAM-08-1]